MKFIELRVRGAIVLVVAIVLATAVLWPAAKVSAEVSYYLPYAFGATASLNQGPGGCGSHCEGGSFSNAYDFGLGGGEIWASAPGTLLSKVTNVQGQTTTLNWGNNVVVKHADNSCTRYAHLAYDTVTSLAAGSEVKQGEYLGREGNTGYTLPQGAGHHLHFQRETCGGSSLPIDFVEDNWTSQNQRQAPVVAPPDVRVPVAADFNGDGYDDLLASSKRGGGDPAPNLVTFLSTTDWLSGSSLWSAPGQISWQNAKMTAGDLDADGKSDLFAIQPDGNGNPNIYWLKSQGSSFAVPQLVGVPGLWFNDVKTWVSGDFNGDNADDLLAVSKRGDTAPNLVVFSSTGSWLGGSNIWSAPSGISWENMVTVPTDLDGDGKTDLLAIQPDGNNNPNIYWLRSTGSSFASPQLVGVPGMAFNGVNSWLGGDFNGDGYGDLLASSQRGDTAPNLIVFTSTGSWLNGSSLWGAPGAINWASAKSVPTDLDNDGKTDLLSMQPNGSNNPNIYWSKSTGSSFAAPQLVGVPGLIFSDVRWQQ